MGTVIVGKATQSAVTAKLSCVVISASFSVLRGEKAEEREMVLVFARKSHAPPQEGPYSGSAPQSFRITQCASFCSILELERTKFYVKQNVKLLFLLMVSAWFRLGCTE